MQRPRLPDDLARAVHQRAVRENRSGQNMLEEVVKAGLYVMDRTPPPPWAAADSGASDDER
jgi:plasmid stability protein